MPIETKNRVTCTGCALLCDDIAIDIQFGTIQAVHNACLRGSKKSLPDSGKQLLKAPTIEGKEASYDNALAEAVGIIKGSKRVIIAGGTHGTNEALTHLVRLASKIGAKLAVPDFDAHLQLENTITNNGIDFFTLGETINNTDLIVFWGANPVDLAPKLLVRTVFSRGRYRQSGKEIKKIAVIDDYPTPTMERADIKVLVDGQDHDGVLNALSTALVEQKAIEPLTADLVEAIKNSEYCTFLLGEGVLNRQFLKHHPDFLGHVLHFVRVLNVKQRVAILPLFYSWNAAGVMYELVSASEKLDCFDLRELPSRVHEGDAVIAFGCDPIGSCTWEMSPSAKGIQVIAIDFKRTPTTDVARVVLPSTISGIDSDGTATRLDGTTVRLQPPLQRGQGKEKDAEILIELCGMT